MNQRHMATLTKQKKGLEALAFSRLLSAISFAALLFPLLQESAADETVQKTESRQVGGVSINVKDRGAKGDGVTNDSSAFRTAASELESAGGGTLVIPQGTYIVGEQSAGNVSGEPFYRPQPIFSVSNIDGLVIEGNGATLRLADGLRYGSFDPDGKAISPSGTFTKRDQQATVGSMIEVSDSKNITIKNLKLDGNSGHLILGGRWGDKGRQLRANGVSLINCVDALIEDIHTHHHGLDGVYVGQTKKSQHEFVGRTTLLRVTSEYNGRQGLSWTGGSDLTVRDSKFNHTGKGALSSSPMGGVDIEPNSGLSCRNGIFENCEFVDNTGPGVLVGSGDGGYSRFVNCLIWGTTNYSSWVKKPAVVFEGCKIYGSLSNSFGSPDPKLATRYEKCHFEDPVDLEYPACRKGGALVICDGDSQQNVTFDGCTFLARQTRALFMKRGVSKVLKNSTVTHSWVPPGDKRVSVLLNTVVENTQFKEAFSEPAEGLYIQADRGVIVGKDVVVDGPICQWKDKTRTYYGPIDRSAPGALEMAAKAPVD